MDNILHALISPMLSMHFMLILCRIGGAFLLFPLMNNRFINIQIRTMISIMVCLVVMPVLGPILVQQVPSNANFQTLIYYMVSEFILGVSIGLIARIYYTVIYTLGSVVSMQSGLGNAALFDPDQNEQSALFSSMLVTITLAYMFVMDIHHIFFYNVIESYERFKVGSTFANIDGITEHLVSDLSNAFLVAFKISSPFIIVSLALLMMTGMLSRLMPTLQVLFVITPLQILIIMYTLYLILNDAIITLIDIIKNHFV